MSEHERQYHGSPEAILLDWGLCILKEMILF
jgi:hypothetical protein